MAIVEVNNLTKEYQLGHLKSLKQKLETCIKKLNGHKITKHEPFKALDDVSFSVEEGEVVGIIGTNGAGKSTLLKHLAHICAPTRGSVKVHGSVAPLIEVGAGLHSELTGRENIFLNAAIMGIPKKVIREKFDEIVAFSELEEFIDTPIKRYSSGMAVRLGFSIATAVDPDILIVDEVLAVGDLAFQRKCFDRMEELIIGKNKTVLLVSHNIRQVERMCSRVILLDQGKIIAEGVPDKVCELFYERSNNKIVSDAVSTLGKNKNLRLSGEIDVTELELINSEGEVDDCAYFREQLSVRLGFTATKEFDKAEIAIGFHTTDFFYISTFTTANVADRPSIRQGFNSIECKIPLLSLMPGVYCLRVGILDKYRREMFYGENVIIFTVKTREPLTSKLSAFGVVEMPVEWKFSC